MSLKYIDEADASLNSAPVGEGETLYEGEFVTINGNGALERVDPASDTLPQGIIVHDPGGAIVEHDEDYVPYEDLWKYTGDERRNPRYQPLAPVDNVIPELLSDNGTDPAPQLTEGTVMGIVTINTQTEVVPAGYTDNAGTQYGNGGAGDFIAIGRIDQKPQQARFDEYGYRVPIRLDADLFTA